MSIKKTSLSLPSFLIKPNDLFHIVRRTITTDENLDYHDHDYAEIFWIKEGSGYHIINGEKIPIKKGTLCMVRPEDTHTFIISGNTSGLVVTNIAFYLESLNLFKERYFPNSDSFFWVKGKLPYSCQLSTGQLNELSGITDYILSKQRDNLHLDIIVLHIFKTLTDRYSFNNVDIPHWLLFAMKQYNTPKQFRNGVSGFVALTNRSTDYVNKTIKQHLNQTLTETITKIKMNYAAQRLTMTNVPIKTICFDCGFNAIGHFYKTFKKYNGLTPKEFRDINYKII